MREARACSTGTIVTSVLGAMQYEARMSARKERAQARETRSNPHTASNVNRRGKTSVFFAPELN